jgi:integrase
MSIRVRCEVCRRKAKVDPAVKERNCKLHKERNYEIRLRDRSGKWVTTTKQTMAEAKEWKADQVRAIKNGTYKKTQPLTFNECADAYMNSINSVRPAARTNYIWAIDTHLKPVLGSYRMADIDDELIDKVLLPLENKSASLKQKVKQKLRAIFKYAIKKGVIVTDITTGIKSIRSIKKQKYYPLDSTQISNLLSLKWKQPWVSLFFKMLIYTGMRPNELIGLSVDCIDRVNRKIRVEKNLYWFRNQKERNGHLENWIFQDCKTLASDRVLPISKDLLKDIEIYLIQHFKENKHNLLFTIKNGQPVCHSNLLNNYWYPARKAASLPDDIPLYGLRHTYCSIMGKIIGLNKKLQYLMGHRKYETTANIYSHLFPEDHSEIADTFDSYMLTSSSQNGHIR